MSDCSLLGWLNFVVLTVTGGVIAWYTIETYRLRREAQRQTELQIRPFLSLEIEGEGFERRARLVNIGRGVAMGISVKNITVSASLELRGAHRELTHLAPGAKSPLPLRMWLRETPRRCPRGDADRRSRLEHRQAAGPRGSHRCRELRLAHSAVVRDDNTDD
jgi:hypothetical protein